MGRCVCILASGPHKGSQCTNQTKLGRPFCGHHKNCEITASGAGRSGSDFELCPDELRPIDDRCPTKFPHRRQLPDGSVCCWGKFKRIREIGQQQRQLIHNLPSNLYGFCTLDDHDILYHPDAELVLARKLGQLNFLDADCQSFNQALLPDLPLPAWIRAQAQYIADLDPSDRKLISFYTLHGDVILNNFARHNWSITEDDFDYLLVKFERTVREIFQDLILQFTENASVERLVMEIYNRLNQIINQSPINPQRFVSYRGSKSKDYFDQSHTIFQNVGFFSSTLLIKNAKSFSHGYMTRIIVPEGYHCLYPESVTAVRGEYEILIPDQSKYYITSDFRYQYYGLASMPTNELVMIKTSPKLLTTSLLQTHHDIRDLILDQEVRLETIRAIGEFLYPYPEVDGEVYSYLQKIWLRRLADHKIYTLPDYMTRGRQLQPTIADMSEDMKRGLRGFLHYR